MKYFGIITNSYKDTNHVIANDICEYINNNGCVCSIYDTVDGKDGTFRVIDTKEVPENIQCIITIGGDGTLLHAAKDFSALNVVFIGVNKGAVGFLAEISLDDIKKSIDRLIKDEFKVESRMMLRGQVIRNDEVVFNSTVLNDIVIHRGADMAISSYDVFVNGQLLGQFNGDGIVLATPTGSTAYNLSAGGPVARPNSHMIILTPICSHTFGSRSILLAEDDEIEVVIGKSRTPNTEQRKIAFDGDGIFDIISGDIIRINKADETTNIVKLDEGSFLQVIKDKLGN